MNNQAEIVDVLVAGGGPAGATIALCLARRGLKVRLVEASSYEKPRYGETLPPEINPILRKLGLWEEFERLSPLPAYGIVSVWGDVIPIETDFMRNVQGCGWHIDRRAFDRMLVCAAEDSGVQVALGERVDARRGEDGMWLATDFGARMLVDATGRNGLRIDGSAKRETEDELIAIALTVELADEPGATYQWTCIESTPDGWWYSAPLPHGGGIAMFFTDPAIYREEGVLIEQQLKHAAFATRRLAAGRLRDSRVLRVSSSFRETTFGNRWLAVGDSAFSLDPISGRGLFNAVRWAEPAADAIVDWLSGDAKALSRFAIRMRRAYEEYLRQKQIYYACEQRWTERRFWCERRGAIAQLRT